ncbi:MAG TPA: hypothetical protein VMC07_00670 [Candidatus Omnitrophota bacterium]|nr:hypothetical protein [Candidatus Omnitrophota bacterium]
MLRKEMMKSEIENELRGKGDYVQIDMLRRFLKENLPNEIKRFALEKLSVIYERRSMFAEAAFLYGKLAEMAPGYNERIDNLLKEVENYIRAGFFEGADAASNKITAEMKPMEKTKISDAIKGFYRAQAVIYERERRRSKAAEIYEKMLTMKGLLDIEKKEINNRLLMLYKDLGMVQKYLQIRDKV